MLTCQLSLTSSFLAYLLCLYNFAIHSIAAIVLVQGAVKLESGSFTRSPTSQSILFFLSQHDGRPDFR